MKVKIVKVKKMNNQINSKVGYGDMYPTSITGKIFGAICAASGILLLACPTGLFASNFSDVYKLNKQKKKIIRDYKSKNNEQFALKAKYTSSKLKGIFCCKKKIDQV